MYTYMISIHVCMWMLIDVWIVQGVTSEAVNCSYFFPLSHRVNCVLTRRYILLLSHAYIEWYNDTLFYLTFFLNNPSLDMEVVLSMIYIAYLTSINPVNPRKNMQSGLHMKRLRGHLCSYWCPKT